MAKVTLIANTGINGNNYIAFKDIGVNKYSVDNWFNSKTYTVIDDLSEIYLTADGIHLNSGSVHVPLSYQSVASRGIDYIKVENSTIFEESDRTYYLIVQKVEQINTNSCRIYFSVDWLASFWDQVEIGECQISQRLERDSINEPSYDQEYSNYLPENFTVKTVANKLEIEQADGIKTGKTLEEHCRDLYNNNSICIVTSTNQSGKIDNPKIVYQCGGSLGGYAYCFNEQFNSVEINKFLNGQVSFSRAFFRYGNPSLSTVTNAFILPQFCVSSGRNDNPDDRPDNGAALNVSFFWDSLRGFLDIEKTVPVSPVAKIKLLNLNTLNSYKNLDLKTKKIMNYISYTLSSITSSTTFSPFVINDVHHEELGTDPYTRWRPYIDMYFNITGTSEGRLECGIRMRGFTDNSQIGSLQVSSPSWPKLFIAGSVGGAFDYGFRSEQ